MNPLDEKLNVAIQDFRDHTGLTIETTREYVLARMRRERLQRWSLGGGSVALLSLALYVVIDVAQPRAQSLKPMQTARKLIDERVVNPVDRLTAEDRDAIPALPAVQPDPMRRVREETPPPPQGQKRGTSNSALTYAITRDAFVDESIALARRASDAVASENLELATESFHALARLCEKRTEWKRAVAAYDSAVSYATIIGDARLLQELTREQALASKNAVKRR